MPSTTLQARINAFETLTLSEKGAPIPSSSTPGSLLEAPLSPTAVRLPSISPTPSAQIPITQAPYNRSLSPSPSPPNLGTKTSLIDLKDWLADDDLPPHATTQNGMTVQHTTSGLRNEYSSARTPTRKKFEAAAGLKSVTTPTTPLISFGSSPPLPSHSAPPLPPRKASYTSLRSVSSGSSVTNGSGSTLTKSSSTAAPPPLPRRTDSLTVDAALGPQDSGRFTKGHNAGSSVSSFHSVSLSSDSGTPDATATVFPIAPQVSGESLGGESYENVSTSSISSPSSSVLTHDWETITNFRNQPPPPPSRPNPPSKAAKPQLSSYRAPASSTLRETVSPSLSASRRAPPAPPPKRSASSSHNSPSTSASDRSSIISNATSITSRSSMSSFSNSNSKPIFPIKAAALRPTPIPSAARQRYEKVFVGNVIQERKAEKERKNSSLSLSPPKRSRNNGWRGLSVDLITGEDVGLDLAQGQGQNGANADDDSVGQSDRLEGFVVYKIWSKSRLDKKKLVIIWGECDTIKSGSLDRDAFIRGMWRIDEELRKAQLRTRSALPMRKIAGR